MKDMNVSKQNFSGADVFIERRHVLCALGSEVFAIPISKVEEIQDTPAITKIPKTESWLLGAINLRGDILSVLDIREFVRCGAAKQDSSTRLIIVGTQLYRAAVLVDNVLGIIEISEEDILPVHEAKSQENRSYVSGVYSHSGSLVSILDIEDLLTSDFFLKYQ